MPKKPDLQKLMKAVTKAHDDVIAAVEIDHPKGKRVGVMLSSRQRIPSPATLGVARVQTHNYGDGTRAYIEIGVRLDCAKTARSAVRRVGLDCICPIEEVAA